MENQETDVIRAYQVAAQSGIENTAPHEADPTNEAEGANDKANGIAFDNAAEDEKSTDVDSEEALYEEQNTDGQAFPGTEFIDGEDELRRLNSVSDIQYSAISDFPGHERYLELRKSGIITAEEAFHAVKSRNSLPFDNLEEGVRDANGLTRGVRDAERTDGKSHLSSSRNKPSSGEVFTRADREELAKWGITATGSELERLWRNAGAF
ncbi:MAG: hypothetical protein IKB34_06720 [Clostridia bacterium]|nr:hypothetical protein [Clostridia bacterium]